MSFPLPSLDPIIYNNWTNTTHNPHTIFQVTYTDGPDDYNYLKHSDGDFGDNTFTNHAM